MNQEGKSRAGTLLTTCAIRWTGFICRRAWPMLLALAIVTVTVLYYTVANIAINTSTEDMLSEDLPHRQTYIAFRDAFPLLSRNLTIVVDGRTADQADAAAAALEAWLRARPDLYQTVFNPASDPFFRRNGLLYLDTGALDALALRLADAQPLLGTLAGDMSAAGLFGLLAEAVTADGEGRADAGGLAPVLEAVDRALEARLAGRPAPALAWGELLRGADGAADRRRILVAQPVLDFASIRPAGAAMAGVRTAVREAGLDPAGGVTVRMTGGVALNAEELDSVSSGAGLAGGLSLLLVLGLLLFGMGSPRLVGATLLTLVTGLVWTAGFAILAVGHLNLISVAFAVLFIGLGVDFGIHFALRYQEERDSGKDHTAALAGAAGGVAQPLALGAICAAAAFGSFLPTSYTGVAELGVIAGAGMFVALFLNLTMLPALLTVLPHQRPASHGLYTGGARRLRDALAGFTLHHCRAICGVALVAGLAGLWPATQAPFDRNPLNLKDPASESVQLALELMAGSRENPQTISVLVDDPAGVAPLRERLEALPTVAGTATLEDYVPGGQDGKLAIIDGMALFLLPVLANAGEPGGPGRPGGPDPAAGRAALTDLATALRVAGDGGIPGPDAAALAARAEDYLALLDGAGSAGSAGAVAELELLGEALLGGLPARLDDLRTSLEAGPVGVADLPAAIRERFLAADGRIRIEAVPAVDLTDNALLRRFVDEVQSVAPGATDLPVLILKSGDAVVDAFVQASSLALLLILGLLVYELRRPMEIAFVLLPLTLAAVLTLATVTLAGLALNFANIIVLPLLVGLGVAGSIHIVLRARLVGEDGDLMGTSTPRAVLLSALTTIGSFGTLAISSHPGTASMGLLLTLAIAITLISTLIVLPAMLHLRRAWKLGRFGAGDGA